MEKEKNLHNTIYDDVFRTIVEKMSWMLIPVINEVFHTNYSRHEKITVLHNEHHRSEGEVITDSCLLIKNHLYHIECQSWPDAQMEIRMIEYDFFIALEHARKEEGEYVMELPRSCTLYLRHTERTPDFLKVHLLIPDAWDTSKYQEVVYETPVIKVQKYSLKEIFGKKLVAFLPYYIMRYEKQLELLEEDREKLKQLLKEYESIKVMLEEELCGEENAADYTDLVNLILCISDYFLKANKEARKGVADVMGGKVLQLESERLMELGKAEGELRLGKLVTELLKQGKTEEVLKVTSDAVVREEYYRLYGI